MGILDSIKKQTEQVVKDNQKDTKQLVSNLEHQYSELIDKINELIKCEISTYQLLKAHIEKKELPEPLVKMEVE